MKNSKLLRSILPFFLLTLSGCAALRLPGVVTVSAPGVTRVVAATPTPHPSVSPVPVLSATPGSALSVPGMPTALPTIIVEPVVLPRYVLNASMDYDAQTLEVQQQIDFANTSGSPIHDIVLAVQSNQIPGVFSLLNLSFNDAAVSDYTLEGQRLKWLLAAPLETGQTAHISLEYHLALPEIEQGNPNIIRPQIFGVTERQINLTDWYPMLVPFDAQNGWRLADPWFYGEHMVYPLANFDVNLRFKDASNMPIIAASALAEPLEGGTHFVLENGRDFVLAMGRRLKYVSQLQDGVTVMSYYYPGSETAGQAVLDASLKAIKTYTHLFGPYPHQSLTAVQGDFNDGMEFDGLYFLSNSFYNLYDGTDKNYLVMVAAHETSHQWWFGRVGSDQTNQPWLDEALATYCEKLFYEKNYPDSATWWWDYRINFYQPEGKIDGDVAGYGGFTPYTNATYRLGARFLEELRAQIGDQAFFAFLKDYAGRMDGKIATSSDFFRILREHSQADLSALLDKYFSKPPE